MTAPIWITPAGFLGTVTQETTVTFSLYATGTNLSYNFLSGTLPNGLSYNTSTNVISGYVEPLYVDNSSTFVIRASNTDGVNDRSFSIQLSGHEGPSWVTPSGSLPVGPNGEYYIINEFYVDYTINADIPSIAPGNSLKYYIPDNMGSLPPGLTMTQDGRIYGYVNDDLTIGVQASSSGGYDTNSMDSYPYDYGSTSTTATIAPNAINKTYQFYVNVTDGILTSQQLFSILVVAPSTLTSDNARLTADGSLINSTVNPLVPPIFQDVSGNVLITPANLGTYRASRYQVVSLHDYDPYPSSGSVIWDWNTTVNPQIQLLSSSNYYDIATPTTNLSGSNRFYFTNASDTPTVGMVVRFDLYVSGFSSFTYIITGVEMTSQTSGYLNLNGYLSMNVPDSIIIYVGSQSTHPPGLSIDSNSGNLYGFIPYQPTYSQLYTFTVTMTKTSYTNTSEITKTSHIFNFTLLGNILSYIQFVTTSYVGSIIPGQDCELYVSATNISSTNDVVYSLTTGALPSSLTFMSDGTIQGRVDYSTVTNTTTNYGFTVEAVDSYRTSAITTSFYMTVVYDDPNSYTRMYLQPFLTSDARESYANFITDQTIFQPSLLYRPNDPAFGIQTVMKMWLETGIQEIDINLYANAMQGYFQRKKFWFGQITSVTAQDSNGNDVYEMIYVPMIDPQMNGIYSPSYDFTVGNMKARLESIQIDGSTIGINYNLQPRFMTTYQSNGAQLGYIMAVPVCYCLPGNSSIILELIQDSGFNFNQFNFDIDRIVIDTTLETGSTGWLYFPTNKPSIQSI